MTNFQKFLSDLSSWYWWVMVVAVGLLINLASAYLKTPIDMLVSKWSSRRAEARSAKESSRHAHAKRLADHPGLLALEIRNEAVNILLSIFFLAIAAVFASLSGWFIGAMDPATRQLKFVALLLAGAALGLIVVAVHGFSRALRHSERIAYVRRYLSKQGDA